MLNFLFWNLQEKRRDDLVVELAQELAADIICLAECDIVSVELLDALGQARGVPFVWNRPNEPSKVRVISRFSETRLHPLFDSPSGRMTIWRLWLENTDLLLAVMHFHSKVNYEGDDQTEEMQNLAGYIRDIEHDPAGHSRTIVFGDFNMNPFERGIASSHGLHAVMTREIAREGSRRVFGSEYPFLYNPMWGCFGDRTGGPAGTHYKRIFAPLSYFWNIFDQVLVRPALLDAFSENVKIVESIGGRSLIGDNGKIDEDFGTDHLPLFFSLNLEP